MRGLTTLLLLAMSLLSFGQRETYVAGRVSKGFLMAHRPTIPQLLTGPSRTAELTYMWRTSGEKDWQALYERPFVGFSGFISDLGNDEALGRMYSVYTFIDFPLVTSALGGLYFKVGVGGTVVTETYSPIDNPLNQVIGSNVNVGILAAAHYQRDIGRMRVGGGLSFTHASNGAYQLPNLGANVPAVDLHLAYRIGTSQSAVDLATPSARDRSVVSHIEVGLGLRESNVVTRQKHPVVELRYSRVKPMSEKMSYSYGADLSFNRATYAELDPETVSAIESLLPGLRAGLTLDIGASALLLEMGGYLYQGYQERGGIYHRFGGRTTLANDIDLSFTLKTHFARADYFAIGIGKRFN